MLQMTHDRVQLSEMAGNLCFETPAVAETGGRPDNQKMGKVGVYCVPPPPHPPTHPRTTSQSSCPDVWAANDLNSLVECEAKLAKLPLAEGDNFYVDGNTCALSPRLKFYSLSRPPLF